ncbi:MAG: hypothetical protein HYU69_07945 [Bacteroidetes bacterium]|nr:hypothetical protein [Bacteroidota bacterium]
MSKMRKYTHEEVEANLNKALSILQERDAVLLDSEFNINERTVTHRLGMYLAELFSELDVDCEYNRVFNEQTREFMAKRVELPHVESELTLEDTEAKTVFPDIIVHKRQTGYNIMAIEVKMGWKNSKGDFDKVKAEVYKHQLGYQYTVFVIIGPGKELKLHWIK